MKEIGGQLLASGQKIALVVSRFNSFLTEQLVKGAVDAFTRMGGNQDDLTLVPEEERDRVESPIFSYDYTYGNKYLYVTIFLMPWIPEESNASEDPEG